MSTASASSGSASGSIESLSLGDPFALVRHPQNISVNSSIVAISSVDQRASASDQESPATTRTTTTTTTAAVADDVAHSHSRHQSDSKLESDSDSDSESHIGALAPTARGATTRIAAFLRW